MQHHRLRTVIIAIALLLSIYYIYPTIGWMTLSDTEREERLEQWKQEDRVYSKPNVFKDAVTSLKRWARFDRSKVINLGLDLQGGIHMVLGIDMDSVPPEKIQEYKDAGWKDEAIVREFQTMAKRTIERRINEFEAKEPVIQTSGDRQIQIQLPGVKDIDRARNLIMQTAQLTFQIAAGQQESEEIFADIEKAFPKQFIPYLRFPEEGSFFEIDPAYIENVRDVVKEAQKTPGLIPEDKMIAFSGKPDPWDRSQRYSVYILNRQVLMTGDGLQDVRATRNQNSLEGYYHILFTVKPAFSRQFAEATDANRMRPMAIVVDGVVESAPTIQSKISKYGSITGSFSGEQAHDLAIALNSGSMPARIKEEFTGVVGATLGSDSIRKGIVSAVTGMILVVFFMLAYYRRAGFVAVLALVSNAMFILASLAYFKATLTLPGIAGLILTIGMAVDANVLIYERIREEIRNGRSLLASVETGFVRARVTILDANITTLIAAAVLMQFGTGPIEGFAVTLSIGVCASVFAALVVSHAIFDFMGKHDLLGKLTMASMVKPETKVGFLAKRNVAISASCALIAIGLVWFGVRQYRPQDTMFGVDFTTGTNMIVTLDTSQDVNIEQVRDALAAAGFSQPIVQDYSDKTTADARAFTIRISDLETQPVNQEPESADDVQEEVPLAQQSDTTVSARVQTALASLAPAVPDPDNPGQTRSGVQMERVQTVGPAVGKQLRNDALQAITYAILFIIVYLWFRFELKFALGAVVALVHDVLVTVGLFALCDLQISLPVVAALLTIIGYSLNDTIVVFDRVREDLRLYRGRGLSYSEIMDLSINQTLSRTLLTSITTLIVVAILLIFGGSVIYDFAFALFVGVIVGTYSSIFIASPVVYYLNKFFGKPTHTSGEDTRAGGVPRRRKSKKRNSNQEPAEA